MDEYDKKDQEAERRLARRRFAFVAFWFMVCFATLITLAIIFHPDRLDMANSLDKTSSILNGIMTAFVAIIMSYLGVSTWEAVSSNKEESRKSFRPAPTPPPADQSEKRPSVEVTNIVNQPPEKTPAKTDADQGDLFPEN